MCIYVKRLSAKNISDLAEQINAHDAAIFESIFKIRWLKDQNFQTVDYWIGELVERPLSIFSKLPIPKTGKLEKRLEFAFEFNNPNTKMYQSSMKHYIKKDYGVELKDIENKMTLSLIDYNCLAVIYKAFILGKIDWDEAEKEIVTYIKQNII